MTDFLRWAERWAKADPDELTRAEILSWVQGRNEAAVRGAFQSPLAFGTAGLRGPVGPGPGAMNAATVLVLARGLGSYLAERWGKAHVVIGYDARPDSERFAHLMTEELVNLGHRVSALQGPQPTPFVAYLARKLGSQAAVAVTASHNPRADAGVKVYDDLGVQIAPPWDVEIARRMGGDRVEGWLETLESASAPSSVTQTGQVETVPNEMLEGYYEWVVSLASSVAETRDPLELPYTPLCGVGFHPAQRLARDLGLTLRVPPRERDPDGTFPHLPFPNPEERGVLDELLLVARRADLDWGAANDPDADRLAAVLPDPIRAELAMVTGDELGLLLGDAWLEALGYPRPLLVTTLVSSPAVDALVQSHGGELRRTLTGFKWICRAADDDHFAFAYEEALGYCFGRGQERPVLDKDGLAALAVFSALARLEMARTRQTPGHALRQRLGRIAVRDGLWVASPRGARAVDDDSRARVFGAPGRLRRNPPTKVGAFRVREVKDYLGAAASEPYAGRQDLQSFFFEDDVGRIARVHVRPSGTEAKLKLYVHVGAPLASVDKYRDSYAELSRVADDLGLGLLEHLELASS